jgi:hypothetical protein
VDSNRESLYLVATGKIEKPSIEINVNGEVHKFDGRDAQVFAFGMLSGMAASGGFTLDISANFEGEGNA